MSLPGLVAHPLTAAIVQPVITTVDLFLNVFNTNPYFIGLMMLMMNLGGRFLVLDVSKGQETFFQHPLFRKFIIFAILFISTRNIWISMTLAIIIVGLMSHLLNECSPLYLFKTNATEKACAEKKEKKDPPGLTPEESDILQRLMDKQNKLKNAYISIPLQPSRISSGSSSTLIAYPNMNNNISDIYGANMSLLNQRAYQN